jgi:twinkle protein
MESTFLRHEPCPNCGSSDALAVFSDGHKYCYSCTTYFRPDGSLDKPKEVKMSASNMIPLEELQISALPVRGITKDTCTKLKYFVGEYKGNPCQVACYYDDKGSLVGQKLRFPDKSFAVLGKISGCLYGSQLWSSGKKLVITEGEIDALSVSQVQGNKWPVVSIPNGAQAARKAIEANLEYLNNFEEIILMFDMDDPGRKACEDCAKILPLGKAYIANLPLKDPNECLKAGRSGDLVSAIWNAKPYRPDGIVSGQDLYEKCVEGLDSLKDSVAYPFQALQSKTNGARHGELYVITSGSGMGKSTLLRELEYFFGVSKGETCGVVALEESTAKTGLELMSIFLNRRLIISVDPDSVSKEELKSAFDATIGNGKFFLYDHFGSLDSGNLLSKLRYMIVALGCKRIFLDHISIVVSGMDNSDDGGERKAIDKLMTNLRSLVEETGCTMYVVSHLKRPDKKGHEEGAQVSLSQLRGSGAIAQLADMVIGLERNQQGDNPNVMAIRVLKNRFSGLTGIGGYLYYDPETGRLKDYDCPFEDDLGDCPF